ncbi:hypothetical protein ASPTUDRAFT_572694 [Aspergillus tubingensis CBS 134.48]|uniref:Uncharacterized protein n=1 Tax=Aspergillus tubingensis (strain CBS 134.48) TaxID=767770 RepID=A0A1L9N7R2_ASPTC|nr:hypothetical protein ASPTUDRAFT_572694 [Aspergillus tubingensis CBS 134.48]
MANDLLLGYGCILVMSPTPGANETPSHVPTGALLRLPSHASERRRHEARIGCIGMHRSTSSICVYGQCFGTKEVLYQRVEELLTALSMFELPGLLSVGL